MEEKPNGNNVAVEIASLNDAAQFDIEELEQRLDLATTVDALCIGNACGGNACAGNVNGVLW